MIELLSIDHAELDELFDGLLASLGARERSAAEIYRRLDTLWARLGVHVRAEHLQLFPAVLQALDAQEGALPAALPESEEIRRLVERLRDDHNFFMHELARAVKNLRLVLADERRADELIDEASRMLSGVKERLAVHNELEEKQLYRWAEAIFRDARGDDLARGLKRELENLPHRLR